MSMAQSPLQPGGAGEEEAPFQRLLQWRKTRRSRVEDGALPSPASPSPPSPLPPPLPPCSCQSPSPPPSAPASSLRLPWLRSLRCLQLLSTSPSPEMRALSRLPVLELLAALDECVTAIKGAVDTEDGAEEVEVSLGVTVLHLLAVLRTAVKEETSTLLQTTATPLLDHLHLQPQGREGGNLLLLLSAWEVVELCRQQSRHIQHFFNQPLPALLPTTALPSGGDGLSLLPSHSSLRSPSRAAPPLPSLWLISLTAVSLHRLTFISSYLDGRLQEVPEDLRGHCTSLKEEAATLAAFIHSQLPPTSANSGRLGGERPVVVKGGEEVGGDGEAVTLWVEVLWGQLRSSRLSSFLSHLPLPLHLDWWTALLSPCTTVPTAADTPLSLLPTPALPSSAASVLRQSALYDSASCRETLLPALAALFNRLIHSADTAGADAPAEDTTETSNNGAEVKKRRSLTGRKRGRASMQPLNDSLPSPPPSQVGSIRERLSALHCLLHTWSSLPRDCWNIDGKEGGACVMLLSVERFMQQWSASTTPSILRSSHLLVRSLLTGALNRSKASNRSAEALSLLTALARADVWKELLQPLSHSDADMESEKSLLSTTQRLLAACTSASMRWAPSSQCFFVEEWPAVLLNRVQRSQQGLGERPKSASKLPPLLSDSLPILSAARLLSTSCVAVIDAAGKSVKDTALVVRVVSRNVPALLSLLDDCTKADVDVITVTCLPLIQRLSDRPAFIEGLDAEMKGRVLSLEAAATMFAFQNLQRLPTSTFALPPDSVVLPCADWLLSRMLRWVRLSQKSNVLHPLPPTGAEELAKEDLSTAQVPPTCLRCVRHWSVALLRAIAVQSQVHPHSSTVLFPSSSSSSPSPSSVVLSVLHRCFVLLAQHSNRLEVERDVVGTCMELVSSSQSAASMYSGLTGLQLTFDCGLSRSRAPSSSTVLHCLRSLAALTARNAMDEVESLPVLLSLLTSVARQPQLYPLSLTDGALLIQCALPTSTSFAPPLRVSLSLCHFLCALVDHRLPLFNSSLSLLLSLLRRLLQSLPSAEAKVAGAGVQMAAAVSRVVVHLTSDTASSSLLSHYVPYFLHDVLTLSRSSSSSNPVHEWEAALQPAVAGCLAVLHEHDLAAFHLTLQSSEKERFRQQMQTYKRSWQWKGE